MVRYYRKKYGNRRYKRYLMGRSRRFRSHRRTSVINSKVNLKTLGRTFKKLGFKDTKTIVLRHKETVTFNADSSIGDNKGYSIDIDFDINNTRDKRQLFSVFNYTHNGQNQVFPYLICKYQLIKVSAIYVVFTPVKNSFDGNETPQGSSKIDTIDCYYNLYDDSGLDNDVNNPLRKYYNYMSSLYRNVYSFKNSDSITFCIKNPRCIRKGDAGLVNNRGQYLSISELFTINRNQPYIPFQNTKNDCLIEEFIDDKYSEDNDEKIEEQYGMPNINNDDNANVYSFGSINFYKEQIYGNEQFEVNVYYKCTVKN